MNIILFVKSLNVKCYSTCAKIRTPEGGVLLQQETVSGSIIQLDRRVTYPTAKEDELLLWI